MYTRAELVLRFTLSAICDSYMNLTVSIDRLVMEKGRDCGLQIKTGEIIAALEDLIVRGWAKAYYLTFKAAEEIEGMPPLDRLECHDGAWFHATEAGKKVPMWDWEFWPFEVVDDGDNPYPVRKDWTPPLN